MTPEQQFFFQVLRDYLNGTQTQPDSDLDFVQICKYAEAHKLGGVFFKQCAQMLDRNPPLLNRLQRSFGAALYHYNMLRADFQLLTQTLDQNQIACIPFKGIVLCEAYPDPPLRTMGDVDILVHAEDRERIRDALSPIGFVNEKWSDTEWDYTHHHSRFELQAELLHRGELQNRSLEGFLNDAWPHAATDADGRPQLDDSFHFLYLIAHIAKHLRWVGVGFRQFFDLAVLMQRSGKAFDWAGIQADAERLDFFRFVKICLALNERWFGVSSPYPTDELTDELFDTVTGKIFSDGVFGFENRENRLQALAASRTDADAPAKSRWKALRKLLFPPYRDLITSQKYAWLRGKPPLLPFAWLLRAIRGRSKKHRRQEAAAYLKASDKEIAAKSEVLKKLGL